MRESLLKTEWFYEPEHYGSQKEIYCTFFTFNIRIQYSKNGDFVDVLTKD
jgi:hypothetical protein